MELSEHEARDAERYREMYAKVNDSNVTIAAFIGGAGALLMLSGLVWGGDGQSNPQFMAGIGVCCLIGGGGYWLHGKSESKRLWREIDAIQERFRLKGKRVDSDGTVRNR